MLPNGETVTVGRHHESTIIPSRSEHGVSATHCKIHSLPYPEQPEIEDCSKHGTILLPYRSFVSGRTTNRTRLVKGIRSRLTEDDVILLGGASRRRLQEKCCAYRLQRIGQLRVQVQVLGLCGILCDFESSACWTVAEIKDAICQTCQIRVREQRLIFDTQELHDGGITLSSLLKKDQTSIVFTLIRRPAEQAEWLERVLSDGEQLLQAPPSIQADPEVVSAAARQVPKSFRYAAYDLRNDRQFALSIVGQRRTAVRYVTDNLKEDPSFLLAALERDAFVFALMPMRHQIDDEFVLEAVRRNPFVLKYAANFQSNRTIVAAAVAKKGSALRYASEGLRDDLGIVAAGVQQNRKSLVYASDALRAEISKTAKRKLESRRHSSRSRSRRRRSHS